MNSTSDVSPSNSTKFNKLSLNQQLMKRYEIIEAEKNARKESVPNSVSGEKDISNSSHILFWCMRDLRPSCRLRNLNKSSKSCHRPWWKHPMAWCPSSSWTKRIRYLSPWGIVTWKLSMKTWSLCAKALKSHAKKRPNRKNRFTIEQRPKTRMSIWPLI